MNISATFTTGKIKTEKVSFNLEDIEKYILKEILNDDDFEISEFNIGSIAESELDKYLDKKLEKFEFNIESEEDIKKQILESLDMDSLKNRILMERERLSFENSMSISSMEYSMSDFDIL